MTRSTITRRRFLGAAAAAGAAGVLLPARSGRAQSISANDKLDIAVVGVGGQGWWNISQIRDQNIVALCDVDSARLDHACNEIPGAKRYKDYRRMLDTEGTIDAVLVATPDHSHAPAALMAMNLGRHVYCEKPLAHSIGEARVMAQLAGAQGLATQMGTQIHAGGNYRRVVELIRSGAIGPVRHAYAWVGKSWSNGRFGPSKPAPATLDWDLWQGPVPARPYCDGLHPANWRRFWNYGTGTLGDMACHYLDLVHWALDLHYPTKVRAIGPTPDDVGTPDTMVVQWEHAARGDMPPVTVQWNDGRMRPSVLNGLRHRDGSLVEWGDGQLFVGEKGSLLSNYGSYLLLPEDRFDGFEPPTPTIPDSIGHHKEWLEACRTGGSTTCNFHYSGALSEAVLLGNAAFRAGVPLDWDAKNMRITNAPEAERYLRYEHRAGWGV